MRWALFTAAAVVLLAAVSAAVANAASPEPAQVVIRHQVRGCHTWALKGGPYRLNLRVRLERGESLVITNNDPMVHQLVQKGGPAVGMQHIADNHMKMVGLQKIKARGALNHMGSRLRLTFPRAGLYRFTTEDLGDYFELKSIGMHNHLLLTVRVG